MGVDFEEVRYMKDFPDEKTLRALIAKLEDPVEDLVRKDSQFKKLGLDPDDYVGDADAVVEVLTRYHRLLQRPIVVGPSKAIIGRPLDGEKAKDRLAAIFS
ncbi:MAG: arsenate reductase [Actinobacteria bacterium]|nr:arsenate reductase [Actinomycetota bacterium]NIV54383.1 arsenate reductase [Actinomycetota bacterium]